MTLHVVCVGIYCILNAFDNTFLIKLASTSITNLY